MHASPITVSNNQSNRFQSKIPPELNLHLEREEEEIKEKRMRLIFMPGRAKESFLPSFLSVTFGF